MLACLATPVDSALAAKPSPRVVASEATTSERAQQDALRAIPLDKMTPADRARVSAVLSNVSIFRRLPTKVIDCDPEMYLFLVRHPDVVVDIWDVLKVSRLQLWQTGEGRFGIAEPAGASGTLRYAYRSQSLHVVYADGVYQGPLLARPIRGHVVLALRTAYAREADNRYHITSRMDCFLNIEPAGAELLAKTVSPLMGQTADNNFLLTAAFVSSLSRTAELNPAKIQSLATKLAGVRPEVRSEFSDIAGKVAHKATVAARPASATER
ncbi:MAG: hypothetical protein ABFC96_17430 [Thermoguttaceae bacterium]